MNEVVLKDKKSVRLFADDYLLYRVIVIESIDDRVKLQEDPKQLENWPLIQFTSLNTKKYYTILILLPI